MNASFFSSSHFARFHYIETIMNITLNTICERFRKDEKRKTKKKQTNERKRESEKLEIADSNTNDRISLQTCVAPFRLVILQLVFKLRIYLCVCVCECEWLKEMHAQNGKSKWIRRQIRRSRKNRSSHLTMSLIQRKALKLWAFKCIAFVLLTFGFATIQMHYSDTPFVTHGFSLSLDFSSELDCSNQLRNYKILEKL